MFRILELIELDERRVDRSIVGIALDDGAIVGSLLLELHKELTDERVFCCFSCTREPIEDRHLSRGR